MNISICQFRINRRNNIKTHSKKEKKYKPLAKSPPRKYKIPNQDKNNLGLQKYQCLPPHVPPFPPGFKSLRNEANDDNPESTDTSRTDKYDTERTDRYDSIDNLKDVKKNDDVEYKDEYLQHQNGNETVINKTKE